ncbi:MULTISPECIES: YncE family protein [Roseomonadaceae]|uniref:YncE family protein n=1 Tax=Falsiroseomonas oleicola TaxID=2801474 RepID=A0ABS6H296_9PROT|nr:YncE family protein [Roseomonas oleicola]MBU8542158.1 YncE family protein [Roseomonas oleicola]
MAWRPIALLLALILPGVARADLVYVLNSADATISVLDATTRQERNRIPVLREPHHMVVTPDGASLLVADSGGNEVFYLNPTTGEVLRRAPVSNPYHLEFSPDGRFLVIASLRRGQVDVLDARTLELRARFRPGDKPSHVAFSPDSRMVYVTIQGDGAVAAFDLTTLTQAWIQPVGPEPAGIIWHRGKLVLGIMGSTHFVTLDPGTREVAEAFTLGRGAHTIYPAPDGQALFATSRVDSRVAEVDPETLTVRRWWPIPGGPDCLAFDPQGRVWMTLRWSGRVAVLDPEADTVETMRVGRSPHGIFYKPLGLGADFALAQPGAVSGTRPMAAPLPGRPGLAPPPPVAIVPGSIPLLPAALRRAP